MNRTREDEAAQRALGDFLRRKNGDRAVDFAWAEIVASGGTSSRRQVQVRTGRADQPRISFVVKRYEIPGKPFRESQEQAEREYTALQALQQMERKGWKSPEPVAFLPEFAMVIMEYCSGMNAHHLFWGMIRHSFVSRLKFQRIRSLIRELCGVLQEIQQAAVTGSIFRTVGQDWYISFLEEQLEELVALGMGKSLDGSIRDRVSRELPGILGAENRCFQHTDFYLNNILQDGKTYVVLDFPNSCIGTKYWDVSHFLVSLDDYRIFRNVDGGMVDVVKQDFEAACGLDRHLLAAMMLVHNCFAFKLMMMKRRLGLRGILMKNPEKHYISAIEALLAGH